MEASESLSCHMSPPSVLPHPTATLLLLPGSQHLLPSLPLPGPSLHGSSEHPHPPLPLSAQNISVLILSQQNSLFQYPSCQDTMFHLDLEGFQRSLVGPRHHIRPRRRLILQPLAPGMQDPLSHVTWLDKTIDPFSYSFQPWIHTLGPHRTAFLKVGDYSPSGFCPVSHVARFQAPCLPEAPSSLTDSVRLLANYDLMEES